MCRGVLALVRNTNDRDPKRPVPVADEGTFAGKAEQPFRRFIPFAFKPGLGNGFRQATLERVDVDTGLAFAPPLDRIMDESIQMTSSFP